jgi:hypothetical protein
VEKLELASKHTLVRALKDLVSTEAKAQQDHVDHPDDESLGWFADGMDTALNVLAGHVGADVED